MEWLRTLITMIVSIGLGAFITYLFVVHRERKKMTDPLLYHIVEEVKNLLSSFRSSPVPYLSRSGSEWDASQKDPTFLYLNDRIKNEIKEFYGEVTKYSELYNTCDNMTDNIIKKEYLKLTGKPIKRVDSLYYRGKQRTRDTGLKSTLKEGVFRKTHPKKILLEKSYPFNYFYVSIDDEEGLSDDENDFKLMDSLYKNSLEEAENTTEFQTLWKLPDHINEIGDALIHSIEKEIRRYW